MGEIKVKDDESIRHARKVDVSPMSMEVLPRLDTFKVHGNIQKSKVLVMVHAGSTLNFMDRKQVKQLGLQIKGHPFSIMTT